MNNNLILSIIIPCYNVGHYLAKCLTSLIQTKYPHNKMEILAVDDGSTDDLTPKIIDYFANKYSFIRAFHKINGGVSDARNYGIAHARGEYIAFVDGDDIVPPNAYTDLMYAAQLYHSNIVSGFVRRFDNTRNVRSYLHKRAIKYTIPHTTIWNTHSLLYDTTVWNKVWKVSFLRRNHLHFIKGIIYEDLPFNLKAQLLSKNSTIIKSTVYYWRWRPGSITDSRKAIDNYRSRLSSLDLCKHLLFKAGCFANSSLYKDFVYKVLSLDLPLFLQNCGDTPNGYIYKAEELTYCFLKSWDLLNSSKLKMLPVKDQVLYYAIRTANLHLLKHFTYVKHIGHFHTSLLSKKPVFKIPSLSQAIIRHLNLRHNSLTGSQALHRLFVDDTNHEIYGTGMFRIRGLQMIKHPFTSNNYHENLSAVLINLNNLISMPMHIARKKTARYKRIFRPKTSWTNARYVFHFNYIQAENTLKQGKWVIKVIDNVNGYMISRILGNPQKASKEKLGLIANKQNKLILSNLFTNNWKLMFTVRPSKSVGTSNLVWMKHPSVKKNYLQAIVNVPHHIIFTPYIMNESQHIYVKGLVKHLTSSRYMICFNARNIPSNAPYLTYQIALFDDNTNHKIKYLFNVNIFQAYHVLGKYTLGVYTSKYHYKITMHLNPVVINSCSFNNNGTAVVLNGNEPVLPRKFTNIKSKIILISKNRKYRYVLTHWSTINSSQRISITVPLLFTNLVLLAGTYNMIEYLQFGRHCIATNVIYHGKDNTHVLPLNDKNEAVCTILSNKFFNLNIKIQQPWTGFSKSKSRRAISYSVLYPLMRLLPLKHNLMLFDSYWGTQFSSNERAIYQFIQRYYPQFKTVWLFKNNQTAITGNGERVRINSLKYWYYLAVAKYIFQNTNMPNQYDKRPGQIETETLHGTFLKHMGFDEPHFKTASRKVQDNFARRISRWDYMITPSKYMTNIASSAFDYHKRILPSGFPRNDSLISNNNPKYINYIKNKLHIPKNKKVILYAPTYRKYDKSFHLNLNYLEKHLSKRYVLLIRLHYFVAHTHSFYENPGFVYDVSDYSNINDLLLISDVLITDYSSIMFDYSYLQRPMIFYAYDMDMYLDNKNRGLYLNYQRSMPGPIVTNQKGIIYCLRNFGKLKHDFHNQIYHFSRKYAQYGHHGNATAKVVSTILHHKIPVTTQTTDRYLIFNKMWHILKIQDVQAYLLNTLSRILPKRNIIIFDSFFGRKYSDNPKALYLYIKKHYPKYKLYWNVNKNDIPYFKAHHIPYIPRFGYKGIFIQASAKYWIVNARRPFRWHKPKGAIVLQTWHGTPLKTIGADVALVTMPGNNVKKYHKQVYEDNKRWDYLLAPNMYSAKIMSNAFRMKPNQMMLTGYPRNDILINSDNSHTINAIKQKLNIPKNKKVILYAPTWRDNEYVKSDEFTAHLHLDLNLLRQHYGNKVIILVRTHYMISNRLDLSQYKDIALNVSNYPDIADLYLISDVLITDYSSVMFDYSILRRPMIFFDYDYDNYAKSTRGFYFNFKENAPGPIVSTTRGVIQQLDAIFNGRWCLTTNYKKFIHKFDKWMDGKACQRVCEQLFSNRNVVVHTLRRPLPESVNLKNGALLWPQNEDFTKASNDKACANYDARKHDIFKPLRAIQLYSTNFHQPLGSIFLELRTKNKIVWASRNDVLK